MKSTLLKSITIIALLALVPLRSAQATTCIKPFPCELYWDASVIFSGRVVAVDREGDAATFAVEKAYKGSVRSMITIYGWDVETEVGERELVFATFNPESRHLFRPCGGSMPLSAASEELAYLEGLSRLSPGFTIVGKVMYRYDQNVTTLEWRGVPVRVSSASRTFAVRTNKLGEFQKTGLPPGIYKVAVDLPDGFTADYLRDDLVVASREVCQSVHAYVHSTASISGNVYHADGTAASRVPVTLAFALPLPHLPENKFVDTDRFGRFTFENVPEGDYVLGVNVIRAPTLEAPYERTLSVIESGGSDKIKVKAGDDLSGFRIVLGPPIPKREIRGRVVWEDGRPAKGVHVEVAMIGQFDNTRLSAATTDETGTFVVHTLLGRAARLTAYVINDSGRTVAGSSETLGDNLSREFRLVLKRIAED